MCGIFGFTNFKKLELAKARESLHTLNHRGPDQWNDYFDKNVYLGINRRVKLPTPEVLRTYIATLPHGAYMYAIDVRGAYNHMRVDPHDWPRLAVKYDNKYFYSLGPPFGARKSCQNMQDMDYSYNVDVGNCNVTCWSCEIIP